MVKLVVGTTTITLSMDGIVDVAAERARIEAEAAETEKYLGGLSARLSSEQFTSKAPEEVVERERQRLADGQARLERIKELLQELAP